ncbi:MAG: S8 family serine peptidase, partial [Planctomycetes bacterium]|nr:S8 family serine peptidase [Planctomycetota bacterium]
MAGKTETRFIPRIHFVSLSVLGVTLSILLWNGVAAGGEIKWRAGRTEMARLESEELASAIAELANRSNARHVVVQFDRPINSGQRRQARYAGMTLLRYLGNHTFFASLSGDDVDSRMLGRMTGLSGIQAIQRPWKLDPRILAGQTPNWAAVDGNDAGGDIVVVYVLFHPDTSLLTTAVDLAKQHGATVSEKLESVHGLVLQLPRSGIEALADEDAVQWIEWPLPKMSGTNDSNRQLTQASLVQAAPYNLNGSGVTVLVYDSGTARASHVDFEGRLIAVDGSDMTNHSTHVAGTIGGSGIGNASFKGMAPGVTLLSYGFEFGSPHVILYTNPGDLETDYDQAINILGADIANNSIGSNIESNLFDCEIQGDYGITSSLIDSIVLGSLGSPFRVVWAAGNERAGSRCNIEGFGAYYSMPPPAGAKNHICVGAVNSNNDSMTTFSSWGPTDDGRLKPDLVAPGCQSNGDLGVTSCAMSSDTAYATLCGTSMAAPTVTGLAALLLQDFRAQFPSEPDPRNSMLKALFVHNAQDLLAAGPDYQTGYGSVRIKTTIDFMRTGQCIENQVDQSGRHAVFVAVDPGDPELKVTLAWDDIPGAPNVNAALVNDLDLRVFDASSQQHYPWTLDPSNPSAPAVRTAADHLNNLEQVVVQDPATGVWRVEIFGFSVAQGPQTFSLCVSKPILPCSSQGLIALGAPAFACLTEAAVQVVDCDLNDDAGVLESVSVTVTSETQPGGETLLLTETGPDSADFRGAISLSSTNEVGVLQIADGDTITATYIDSDDGMGNLDGSVTATGAVDCLGPVIGGVQVVDVDIDRATVIFNTDEWSTGTVHFGLSCESLSGASMEAGTRLAHALPLTDLLQATEYFFTINAADQTGNIVTDDNGGACYSFFTRDVVFDFPLDVDPGWSVEGDWAFGQPTGGGIPGGNLLDPTEGYSGDNVYGYNLDGNYANDIPETLYLTTTALDLSQRFDTELRFWRWLLMEPFAGDFVSVQVSNDGTNWVTVWDNLNEIVLEPFWVLQSYDISAIADGQPEVYIRWGLGPTNEIISLPGWNIDDIRIMSSGVPAAPTCDDGQLNQDEDRIDCGGPCPPCACTLDIECDDGLFCNGSEYCDSFGFCRNGADVDCGDGILCTTDTCDPATGCMNTPVDAACDDGNLCTADACNTMLGCINDGTGITLGCDDGNACTTGDACQGDAGGTCQGTDTSGNDCDDGIACTTDSCDSATGCTNTPADLQCDDGNLCTADTCDTQLGCVHDGTGIILACDDGDGCTTGDVCRGDVSGTCQGTDTSGEDCDDGVDCTIDTCDLATGCTNTPVDLPCDDSNVCTADACDRQLGCVHDGTGITVVCDDNDVCTSEDTCQGDTPGTCRGVETSAVDCDDQIECTEDTCHRVTGCANTPVDALCDDGNVCTLNACMNLLGCVYNGEGITVPCDDGDACTTRDECLGDANGTCVGTFSDSDDDGVCDAEDICPGGDDNLDGNGNGVPDACEVATPLSASGLNDRKKNRYISFQPNNPGLNVRLRVTLNASLPHPGLVGSSWWVRPPVGIIPGILPKPLLGPGECVALLGPESAAGDLDWQAADCQTLHVTGCAIEPTSVYFVAAVIDNVVSPVLLVATALQPAGGKFWGDAVGNFDGIGWTPPQGVANIDDVVAAIRTFSGGQVVAPVPGSSVAHVSIPDVEPGNINTVVNFA